MQSVGKFYDYNANILCHRKEHSTKVFSLLFLFRLELYLIEFGYARNEFGNLVSEKFTDLLVGCRGIFDAIVQKRGGKR